MDYIFRGEGEFFYDYQSQYIMDKECHVLEIRAYGRISNAFGIEDGNKVQDELGQWVCDCLNSCRGTNK